ncbi:MAG: radical SAM family heme chaperone HemW, partial [Fimbriimonadales bacterium]|nr:radical SAM family heme chaperone HemW [Fimbriimonadales bacterium]
MQGLYIHIPFCHRKCGYCDFNSYAGLDALVEPFIDALHAEIARSPYAGARFETVFFGGGTPTYLSGDALAAILEHLTRQFQIAPDAEITCEANPGSVSLAQLRTMRQAGFNRLSFGVQSFHPDELRRMDRIHSPEDVVQSVEWARAADFQNLNLDLIFVLPQQTLARWESNLQQAIALQPEHLSLYALMLEPNTRFYHLYQKGKLYLPDDEEQVAMFRCAQHITAQAGYRQYEIS